MFYALFGIPLGRLADNWIRVRLLSLGLFVWSGMTALSGLSTSFMQLSMARVGVGIGEASASPSAFSMLSDWFPKERRATALAIYSAGLYIGGGVSLLIGAIVVKAWNGAYPAGGPMGLAGWQAAFLAVGIPGMLLAAWVSTLKEPIRGRAEGPARAGQGRKYRRQAVDRCVERHPAADPAPPRPVRARACWAPTSPLPLAFAALATLLIKVTGDVPQWIAICLGGYAVTSWAQSLKERDRPTYALIWGTPTFILALVGFGTISFVGYSIGFWATPYAIRTFVVPMAAAGAAAALVCQHRDGGADPRRLGRGGRVPRRRPRRLCLGLGEAPQPRRPHHRRGAGDAGAGAVHLADVHDRQRWAGSCCTTSRWPSARMYVGIAAATTQDLVLPRMRGAATATYFIGTTLIGLGLGPYFTGAVSKVTGEPGDRRAGTAADGAGDADVPVPGVPQAAEGRSDPHRAGAGGGGTDLTNKLAACQRRRLMQGDKP